MQAADFSKLPGFTEQLRMADPEYQSGLDVRASLQQSGLGHGQQNQMQAVCFRNTDPVSTCCMKPIIKFVLQFELVLYTVHSIILQALFGHPGGKQAKVPEREAFVVAMPTQKSTESRVSATRASRLARLYQN